MKTEKKLRSHKIMKLIVLLCFVLALCGFLFFKLNYHRINFTDSDITKCPKYARTGEIVEVETAWVTDVYMELYVDGQEIEPVMEGLYRFEMPDHDVFLKTNTVANFTVETPDGPIYFEIRTPVRAIYDRVWEYGDTVETEDPEIIDEIVEALRIITISSKSVDYSVEDFTDVVRLVFEDGSEETYVFEEYYYVSPLDQKHYLVTQGLDRLRNVLDYMMENR